jgi:hypothetical protein
MSPSRRRRLEPRDAEEFIHRARRQSRRPAVDAATAEILDAFDAAHIDALLLKGPALARMLYRPGEARGYYDVDLLVAPDHLTQARATLAGLGYEGGPEVFAIDDVGDVVNAEAWFRTSPIPKIGAIEVDLHWRLAGADAPPDVAWAALASARTSIEVAGRRAAVLDRPGLALHAAMHAAQHGPGDLKAIGDLERAIAYWPIAVWQAALALAQEVGAVPALSAGLRLVPAGAALAGELALPQAEGLTWAILHRDERPRGTFHLDALAGSRGLGRRVDVLRRSLLPDRRWILDEYPWATAGRGRLALAYLAHLLRTPLWAARALRYRVRERGAAKKGG